MSGEEIKNFLDTAKLQTGDVASDAILQAYNIEEFLGLEIPPHEDVLSPIIKAQSLIMLFAIRGIGKTFIALAIAYAIASGGSFLKWNAPKPRRVIYIDGEMPASVMQERLAKIVQNSETKAEADYFTIITPDMQNIGMPDISTQEGQNALEDLIKDADVIVVDNISTLARTGKENEAEGWLPIQGWALQMRSRGKCVIFIHHAGKSGQQRGTSRREDVLDLVMELRRPGNYCSDQGVRFEVHFTKARHLTGRDAAPFEATMLPKGWAYHDIDRLDDNSRMKVLELKKLGRTVRKIAEETGISKSEVGRILKANDHD